MWTRLRSLIALQRLLTWALPGLTVAFTVTFFVMLVGASPLLTRASIGQSVSRGVLAALAILSSMLASVWIYGRLTSAVEKRAAKDQG
ncbi:MAG TPA: hypothetical protein VHB68_17415 [Steroidobacteraceae bacterium]|nr:hypothetical protein [Steroidobacteraceae bacterium]